MKNKLDKVVGTRACLLGTGALGLYLAALASITGGASVGAIVIGFVIMAAIGLAGTILIVLE